MNVYVWESVAKCSDSYHSGGGVVVFANTLKEARNLANGVEGCSIREDEAPDEVRQCTKGKKKVFILPDAGCC